ncbi:hypothetical protein [Nocardia amamiensis]|uniref:hypothetical protein n=1 Tax=Nocardia amamiensis TaxID=404578 RepID=UPI000A636E58|nr:hypothetical protein [Nocardia amamiensis]
MKLDRHCPPGASEKLRTSIVNADTAIQIAVDLLGHGMTTPPPEVSAPDPVVCEILGMGKTVEHYHQTAKEAEASKLALLQMDKRVKDTSVTIASEQMQTLRSIQNIVADLEAKLASVGSAKLKPPQELPLFKAIANAVEAVYEKVRAISLFHEYMANGGAVAVGSGTASGGGTIRASGSGTVGGGTGIVSGSGRAGGSGSGTVSDSRSPSDTSHTRGNKTEASSGSGAGGLGSLLQMLAMVPTLAAPQVREMLQKAGEDNERKSEQKQYGDVRPALVDPNVPLAVTAASSRGRPASVRRLPVESADEPSPAPEV